jgi:hypothetical protein
MRFWKYVLPLLASSLCFAVQPDRITSPIDSSQAVALKGNVRDLAWPGMDLGRTDSGQTIHGVTLVFHPSAAQQRDLNTLLSQQQDRNSRNYHKWLTPAQFADRFGMTAADIARATAWLESQGFTVTSVANSRNQITFDGTVAQLETTFAAEFHNYDVEGVIHFGNAKVPSVPAALAPSVLAIGHLHNFAPRPRAIIRKVAAQSADPHFTSYVSGNHFLSPADFATIYDVQALYTAGFTGTGQKIAVIGQSTVSATDLSTFRSLSGLPANAPTYTLVPSTSKATRCKGDEGESDLDLEWSNAVAQNATVIFVYAGLVGSDTCTNRTNSVWNALQYAVDNNVAPVISTSYGYCESGLQSGDPGFVQTVQGWAQQANTQGQTIMSASGDAGAADCDSTGAASATGGIAVDVPASIPEVTGMGGTEFSGDAAGTVSGTAPNTNAGATTYWSGTTGSKDTISSALEYIPEVAWNDTVTNSGLLASGGGASTIFSKPTWQTGTGVPNDSKRDVPDLAVNASPYHDSYLLCSEDDATTGATSCAVGFRESAGGNLTAVGGTSAAAPTFAGILTLIDQYLVANHFQTTAGLGNINPNLYYMAAGNPSAFHDITSGNNIVPCTSGTANCPAGTTQYGFTAGTGYDQVTGLGSVDADLLAVAWGDLSTATTTSVAPSTTSTFVGSSVTLTASVTPATTTGSVNFFNNGSASPIGSAALSGGTATFTTASLPVGTNSITGAYVGINGPSTSSAVAVAVSAPFSMSASPSTFNVPAGQTAISTITIAPLNGYTGTVSFTPSSCTGLSTGAACSFNQGGSVTLNGSTSQQITLTISTSANMAPGTETVTVTGISGSSSVPVTIGLTVAPTNQSVTIAPQGNAQTVPVTAGGIASIQIAVTGTNGFITNGSTTALPLTYSCTGLPSESTGTFSPSGGTCSGSNPISATALTLAIATTAPTGKLSSPFGHGSGVFYALLLPGMLGIVFVGGSRTRGVRLLSLMVVLSFSTLWLGACGGSGGTSKNPGTPAGTYPVVVKATTGGTNPLTSTFTINLTVAN